MEKTGQNGDVKGTAPEQDLEIAEEAGDPSEGVNGEVKQQVSEPTSTSAASKDLTGSEQEVDDLLTEDDISHDISQQETSRTSDLEEEEVSDNSKAEDQLNGKVSEEEEEEESKRQKQNLEGQNLDVKQEIGEVIEVVEEIEIIEERQAPVEETQQKQGGEIKDDTEPEDTVVEKRKIKYVEQDIDDLDLSDGPDSQEGGSVAEFEEKQNTETIVEASEEEEEEEEDDDDEEEEEDQHTDQQRLQSQQDLVDGDDHKTKETIQSVQRTYTKEPTKEKDKDSDDEEEDKGDSQRLTVSEEPLQRRKSSTENFLKLKNRFSSEIIDENNKKNVEGEKRNKEQENERAKGASNMSDAKKRFGGTSEKCTQCNRTVYPMEKMEVAGRLLHKTCFKCCKCNSQLSVGRFSIGGKDMYCMTHYKQAFREKGTYDVFTPDNPIKGKWENK